jgi:TolB protein
VNRRPIVLLGTIAALVLAVDAGAKPSPKAADRCPAWSPDGTQLAYSGNAGGSERSNLYVIRADGSHRVRLTRTAGVSYCPAWSPDGRRVAFTAVRRGRVGLYVIDADGRSERLLARDASPHDPAWSPDGERIAFTREIRNSSALFVIDADGSNERRLTRNPGRFDVDPAWSPDGRTIVFASQSSANTADADLFLIGADGRHERRLTAKRIYVDGPSWSPDGNWIAFARDDRKGEMSVYVIGAKGTTSLRLTRPDQQVQPWPPLRPSIDAFPAWSPDGKRLAFASDRSGSFRLYVMAADGSNQVQLTR